MTGGESEVPEGQREFTVPVADGTAVTWCRQ